MSKISKHIFFNFTFFSVFLFSVNLLKANTLGFGITGHWGMNIWGFDGKKMDFEEIDAEGNSTQKTLDSSVYSGQNVGGGIYIEYLFGVDREENFGFGIAGKFNRRDIIALFKGDDETKASQSIYERIEQDCLDFQLELLLNMYRGDWVTFGMHVGGGGYISLLKSISAHDVEPTRLQIERANAGLKSFNIYALLGFHWNFLDRMMELRLTTSFYFLNQVDTEAENNIFSENFGNEVSVGKFQIAPIFEFRINMWEVITA